VDLKLVCALIVPLRGKRAQVTMVRAKISIVLLLVSSCAFAQDSSVAAAAEAPAGLPVCTPADAQKYNTTSKDQCRKLGDIRAIGSCTACAIERKRKSDLLEIDISNMLAELDSGENVDKCLTSADKHFNSKGPGFSLHKKEEWLEKCYEVTGAIIKQGDDSAPVPFDLTKTTKSETIKSVDQSDDTKKDTSNEEDDSNKKAASGDAADLPKSSVVSYSKFQNRILLSLGGAFACGLLSGAAYIQRQKMATPPGTPNPPHPLQSGLLWVIIISAFAALAFVGIAIHQTVLQIYKEGDGEH